MMKKLSNSHILIIGDINPFGGSFSYFKQLFNLLYKSASKVSVVLSNSGPSTDVRKFVSGKTEYLHIETESQNIDKLKALYPVNIIAENLRYKKYIAQLKPDLILITSSIPGKYFRVLGYGVPCLYILHSYPTISHNPFHLFESNYIKNKLCNNILVASVSSYAVVSIKKFWGLHQNKTKIKIIPTGLDVSIKSTISERKNTYIDVITIGTLIEYKNVELWFRVASDIIKEFRNVRFWWIGKGPLQKTYQKKVKEAKLEKNIKLVGYQKDVYSYLSSSDIYFQPSLVESQGLAVVEAMAHSLPIVVSNQGGLPEMVDDRKTGFVVDIHNYNEVKNKLLLLINNKKLRTQLGTKSRNKYLKYYSLEQWENTIKTQLDSLLNNKI